LVAISCWSTLLLPIQRKSVIKGHLNWMGITTWSWHSKSQYEASSISFEQEICCKISPAMGPRIGTCTLPHMQLLF